MRQWLIDEWRDAWRFATVWAAGAGFAALTVWNMMPGPVRQLVPDWIEVSVGLVLWGLVFLARIVRQPGAQAAIDAKREGVDAPAR